MQIAKIKRVLHLILGAHKVSKCVTINLRNDLRHEDISIHLFNLPNERDAPKINRTLELLGEIFVCILEYVILIL